jgi:integration host factor subunit alpha
LSIASENQKDSFKDSAPVLVWPQEEENGRLWLGQLRELDMAGRTITRADLCEAVYQKLGLSRAESAELVETVLKEISDTLVSGETVKLSSFGSFIVREKGERIGRNPKTGVEVPITPRRVLVFKPSNVMKARINGDEAANDD